MKSVLFVISIYNYHREVFPVVSYFCERGCDVVVLLGWDGPTSCVAMAEYREIGCKVVRVPPEFSYTDCEAKNLVSSGSGKEVSTGRDSLPNEKKTIAFSSLKTFTRQKLYFLLRKVRILMRGVDCFQRFCVMRDVRRYAHNLLNDLQPSCVYQGPFHSIGKFDNAIYFEAGRIGAKRFCYPVSAYHGRSNVLHSRFGNIRSQMLPDRLLSKFDVCNTVLSILFPKWTNDLKGQRFFFDDPFVLLAATLSGTLLDDLWQKPQPKFDKIFVYSAFSANLLDDGTFPMHRVLECGIPLLDDVTRSLKKGGRIKEIYSHLGLRTDERFLLFNVEPSLEHHYADPKDHWRNFEKMMEVVTSFGLPVVLSLHPLCKAENYKFAKEKFGVSISTQFKIHTLYPLAALVVSFPCSTNIMAELFDKRLVVYDLFGVASKENGREREFRLPYANIGASFEAVSLLLRDQVSLLGTSGSSSGSIVESDACERIYEHSMELCDQDVRGEV